MRVMAVDSASLSGAESTRPESDPYTMGMGIALRKLNAHARTHHEISVVLSDHGINEDTSILILTRLTDLGYLNDAEFAHAWVRSRMKSRGLAPSVLRRELSTKGVDPEHIDSALADIDPTDTLHRARELAEKKNRSLSGVPEAVAARRISSLLQRKGYSAGVSWVIARDVVGPVEELGEPPEPSSFEHCSD